MRKHRVCSDCLRLLLPDWDECLFCLTSNNSPTLESKESGTHRSKLKGKCPKCKSNLWTCIAPNPGVEKDIRGAVGYITPRKGDDVVCVKCGSVVGRVKPKKQREGLYRRQDRITNEINEQ